MNNDKNKILKNLKKSTCDNCKMLFAEKNFPWECGFGWFKTISDASLKLEALNSIFYKTFRIHIEAIQIKEKFGQLRYYYTIIYDKPFIIDYICKKLDCLLNFFETKIKYNMKHIILQPDRIMLESTEIDLNTENHANHYKIIKDNDFACSIRKIHYTGKGKWVPTCNKLLYNFSQCIRKFKLQISCMCSIRTSKQEIGACLLDELAHKIIRDTETKCYSVCEQCGCVIGTNYSPRCETTGWITYICNNCAKGHPYIMNGVKYDENGNVLKILKEPESKK